MSLNELDVARIAKLARLDLPENKRAVVQAELNDLLHLIERLQAVDTAGVEPMAHPLSMHQDVAIRLREDVVTDVGSETQRAELTACAPEFSSGLFLVPKVIE